MAGLADPLGVGGAFEGIRAAHRRDQVAARRPLRQAGQIVRRPVLRGARGEGDAQLPGGRVRDGDDPVGSAAQRDGVGERTLTGPAGGSAQPTTGSPTATSGTPSPTASTTPATSTPGIAGRAVGKMACMAPDRIAESTGLIPLARTLIRTCPGPGSGTGTSARCRTSGAPNVSNTTALISQTSNRSDTGRVVAHRHMVRGRPVRRPHPNTVIRGSTGPCRCRCRPEWQSGPPPPTPRRSFRSRCGRRRSRSRTRRGCSPESRSDRPSACRSPPPAP